VTTPVVTYEKAGHCGNIRFKRPPGGDLALAQASAELNEICSDIAWDEEVRVVLLVYKGEDFAGFAGDPYRREESESPSPAQSIAGLKQPVICAVDGDATGPGLELALACDVRIGTEGARFGLPQIIEGTIPSDGGTQRLPRLVGRGRALEMILTGQPIEATEALRIGLINRLVSPSDLMTVAAGIAGEMASKSPLAVSYVKEALSKGMDMTLDQGMAMELDLYLLLFTTEDRVEGITAFKEKRRPEFKGE
jgi:enoyl-CoA hydratase/carnithine racemase